MTQWVLDCKFQLVRCRHKRVIFFWFRFGSINIILSKLYGREKNLPSHVARQILNAVLCYWVKAPCTTSSIFFLPNVYAPDWGKVNKYITHVGTYYPRDFPFTSLLSSQVPLTLLFYLLLFHILLTEWTHLPNVLRTTGTHANPNTYVIFIIVVLPRVM